MALSEPLPWQQTRSSKAEEADAESFMALYKATGGRA